MPWCPKCKTEYREGITHCADCKTELVSDYNEVLSQNATAMLVKTDDEHQLFTKKLVDFLAYSGIPSVVRKEDDMLAVYVEPKDFTKAKKCFKAYYSVESEMVMQQAEEAAFLAGEDYEDYFGDTEEADSEASEDALYKNSSVNSKIAEELRQSSENKTEKRFVSAVSRYDDYRSSGSTFTLLGVLGILFAVLNFMDVIHFGSTYTSIVLFIMFGIFLVLGIFSFMKAGQLKEGAEKEKQLLTEVKTWMANNFSDEMLSNLHADGSYEEEPKTEELLYLDRIDQLIDTVISEFPTLHPSLAEQLIEEFYNEH